MWVELLEGTTFRGKKIKKGAKADMPQGIALKLCSMTLAKACEAPRKPTEAEAKAKAEKAKK